MLVAEVVGGVEREHLFLVRRPVHVLRVRLEPRDRDRADEGEEEEGDADTRPQLAAATLGFATVLSL
jgi:hypothetical protein